MPKRLKRATIKEELVALTGDHIKALILNQFIYWSERVSDFDKFIAEEKTRAAQTGIEININPTHGWIYKTAEEMSEETMLNLASNTMLRHIKALIKNGWIEERNNPVHKWDRTKQYRVNLIKVHNDLQKMGYFLQGYKIDPKDIIKHPNNEMESPNSKIENAFSKMENGKSKMENAFSINEHSNFQNGKWSFQNRTSSVQNGTSKLQNGRAIPEITTEITTEPVVDVVPPYTPQQNQNNQEEKILDIIRRIQSATGEQVDEYFAQYLLSRWPYDYICQKIEVARVSKIDDSVTGFIRKACEEDWPKPNGAKKTSRSKRSKNCQTRDLLDIQLQQLLQNPAVKEKIDLSAIHNLEDLLVQADQDLLHELALIADSYKLEALHNKLQNHAKKKFHATLYMG